MTYTILLKKSIGGVRLVSWRKPHKKTVYFNQSPVPIELGRHIGLTPKDNCGKTFSNVMFNFSNSALDDLKTDENTISIRRSNAGVLIKLQI